MKTPELEILAPGNLAPGNFGSGEFWRRKIVALDLFWFRGFLAMESFGALFFGKPQFDGFPGSGIFQDNVVFYLENS